MVMGWMMSLLDLWDCSKLKQDKRWGIDPYPHFLLLSNSSGRFEESSANINDENNGLGQYVDVLTMQVVEIQMVMATLIFLLAICYFFHDGEGRFTIHPYFFLQIGIISMEAHE